MVAQRRGFDSRQGAPALLRAPPSCRRMQAEIAESAFRRLTPAVAKADPAGLAELAV